MKYSDEYVGVLNELVNDALEELDLHRVSDPG